ncbi:MAG: hypothetical protein LC130_23335 [Bryobacterales bacterium]|nr:hypothetical protein [Bryobacterales bacterium]
MSNEPLLLLPATCATSQPVKRRRTRKQTAPVTLPEKPTNWAAMTQAERSKWHSAQCHAITTTDDKRWNKLVESIQDKWPYTMTPEERREATSKLNLRGLADIAYGR